MINNNIDLAALFPTPLEYFKAYCLQDSVIVVHALIKFSEGLLSQGFKVPLTACITCSSVRMHI